MANITRISFNINGANFPNRDYFLDFLRRYQPSTVLIMDDRNLAISLAAALPNTKVVHRSYAANEGVQWQQESPESYVARETAWGHPEVFRYVLNEPPVGDTRLISWLVDVGKRFIDKGYGAVLGNFAVGTYNENQVESGYLDPLTELCCRTPLIYFGDHHYTGILLPMGVGQWTVEQLYDKSRCQPKDWPTLGQIPVKRWYDEKEKRWNLPPYWNLRRSDWITIRAQEKGFGVPKIWITEFGWDALSSLADLGVYDHFKNKYGIPYPHTSMRCINTLQNIWRDYFQQWTYQRAGFEQLKWANNIYPDNCIGFNLFTVNGNHDWKIAAGCDFSDLREVHDLLLAEKQAAPPPPPAPIPLPSGDVPFPNDKDIAWSQIAIKSTTMNGSNIRRQPSLQADIVGILRGQRVTWLYPIAKLVEGYKWYAVRLNEVRGWMRDDVFSYEPIPADDSIPVNLTAIERAALKSIASKLP